MQNQVRMLTLDQYGSACSVFRFSADNIEHILRFRFPPNFNEPFCTFCSMSGNPVYVSYPVAFSRMHLVEVGIPVGGFIPPTANAADVMIPRFFKPPISTNETDLLFLLPKSPPINTLNGHIIRLLQIRCASFRSKYLEAFLSEEERPTAFVIHRSQGDIPHRVAQAVFAGWIAEIEQRLRAKPKSPALERTDDPGSF